jgi:transcriptional antiterminator Rof (Rho-off)
MIMVKLAQEHELAAYFKNLSVPVRSEVLMVMAKEQDQLMKRLDRVSSLSKKGCVSHVRHVLVVV